MMEVQRREAVTSLLLPADDFLPDEARDGAEAVLVAFDVATAATFNVVYAVRSTGADPGGITVGFLRGDQRDACATKAISQGGGAVAYADITADLIAPDGSASTYRATDLAMPAGAAQNMTLCIGAGTTGAAPAELVSICVGPDCPYEYDVRPGAGAKPFYAATLMGQVRVYGATNYDTATITDALREALGSGVDSVNFATHGAAAGRLRRGLLGGGGGEADDHHHHHRGAQRRRAAAAGSAAVAGGYLDISFNAALAAAGDGPGETTSKGGNVALKLLVQNTNTLAARLGGTSAKVGNAVFCSEGQGSCPLLSRYDAAAAADAAAAGGSSNESAIAFGCIFLLVSVLLAATVECLLHRDRQKWRKKYYPLSRAHAAALRAGAHHVTKKHSASGPTGNGDASQPVTQAPRSANTVAAGKTPRASGGGGTIEGARGSRSGTHATQEPRRRSVTAATQTPERHRAAAEVEAAARQQRGGGGGGIGMVTPPPLTAEHLALQALEQQLEDLSHGTNNMQTARSAAPGSAWSPMSGGGGGGAGEARRTRSRSFLKSRSSGAMGSLAADAAQQYATDSSSAEESARRAPLSPPTEFVMNPIRKMSASAEAQASEQALGRKRSSKSLTGGERRRSGSFGGGGAASVGGGGGGGAVVVSSYTEKRPSAASLMGDRKRSSEAMMAERRKAADAMAELSRSGRALSVASSYAPPPSVGGSSMAESSYVSSASSASTASSLFDQPGGLAGEWLGSDMSVSSVPPSPESVTTHKKKKAPQLDTRHV